MSRLIDLIAQAKAKDPQLGADLDREFKQLSSRLPFGLNFERHRPEAVELPQRPNRKGDKVRVHPPRGLAKKGDSPLWQIHEQPRPHRRTGVLFACGLGGVLRLPPVEPTTLWTASIRIAAMMFWVGTTDTRWFQFLAPRHLDEVNFWQPSVRPAFENAPNGMPFVFKVKRPHNHIAGAGYFIARSVLPLELAWEIFGQKNGAASLAELRELLGPLAARGTHLSQISCQVIANPVFFKPRDWLPDPPGWSSNIVRGKMYQTEEADGATIWAHVLPLLARGLEAQGEASESGAFVVNEPPVRYGEPILMRPRLGQGSFRVVVTEAYRRKCAITGESTLLALEAAHIVPYAEEGAHDVRNGLLLRADFHRLFDAGLVSVTPDMTIRVSPRIREAWFNGKAYYRMDGQPLTVMPTRPEYRPDPDRLQWHLKNRFQA